MKSAQDVALRAAVEDRNRRSQASHGRAVAPPLEPASRDSVSRPRRPGDLAAPRPEERQYDLFLGLDPQSAMSAEEVRARINEYDLTLQYIDLRAERLKTLARLRYLEGASS